MTVQINPDPHVEGFQYTPDKRVTADFVSLDAAKVAAEALRRVGLANDVHTFVGPDGADQLDISGERHGGMIRARRLFQEAVADEMDILHAVDARLRNGGTHLSVLTDGTDEQAQRVADVLRGNGGRDIFFWDDWTVEKKA